jgi:hypothetical protein
MKKTNIILIATAILFSMIGVNSYAQVAMNNVSLPSAGDFGKHHSSNSSSTNAKAEKNFTKNYKTASNADWSTLSDKSLLCRFYMNDILYKAFYTAQGEWRYSLSSYGGKKLDKELADRIHRVYYGSEIVFVDQIDIADGKTIYVVELHDENSIRKLRVEGDEMELVQEFKK